MIKNAMPLCLNQMMLQFISEDMAENKNGM